MKRLWISAAILLALTLIIGGHILYLSRLSAELEELLTRAEEQVSISNWSQGESLTRQALDVWEKNSFYLHTVLHHDDIDEILIVFQETLAFLEGAEPEPTEYAAANARLTARISLLLESELPTLKNLL